MRRSRSWLKPLALALVLAVGLAACGDDDEDVAEPTAEGTTTTAGAEFTAADLERYCDLSFQVETIPEPDIDFESLSPEEQREAARTFASEELGPIVDQLREVTPSEVEDEAAVLFAAFDQVVATGEFEAFETPEAEAAFDTVHQYDLDNCGWAVQDVTGSEYAFEGIPSTMDAGRVSFEFTNADSSEELHELAVFRKNAGLTESFDEILELPEEESQGMVTQVALVEPIPPGEDGYSLAELEAGEYIALCFLPVGATPDVFARIEAGEAPPPELEDAPPHFAEGMRAEFTVE